MSFAGGAKLAVRSTGPVRNPVIDEFNIQVEKLWIRFGNKRLGSMGGMYGHRMRATYLESDRARRRAVPLLTAKPAKEGFVSNDSEPLLSSMNLSMMRETLLTREILVIAGGKGKCYQAVSKKERGMARKARTAEGHVRKPAIRLCWR
jgi:hypothetical protein